MYAEGGADPGSIHACGFPPPCSCTQEGTTPGCTAVVHCGFRDCWFTFCVLQASLGNFGAALADARKCVSLEPDWARGHSRLGAAHFGLGQWTEAGQAYRAGERCCVSVDVRQRTSWLTGPEPYFGDGACDLTRTWLSLSQCCSLNQRALSGGRWWLSAHLERPKRAKLPLPLLGLPQHHRVRIKEAPLVQ